MKCLTKSKYFQELNSSDQIQGSLTPITSNNNKTVQTSQKTNKPNVHAPKKNDKAAWFKLFAELDPLANPDNLPGSNTNQSHAA